MENQSSFQFDTDLGVMYKLGSIESQLKAINDKLDKKEAAQDKEIENLHGRVNKLETWRNVQWGGAAAIAAIIGFLVKVIPVG